MVNPHQDNGVPWNPNPEPVSTGTPNFGGIGTGGNNQPPPPVNNNQVNNDVGVGVSVHTDQPYTPPVVEPEVTDLRIMETLAAAHGSNPKYGKSWAMNPDNPENLLNQTDYYGNPMHTLGSFVATDSSGNAILDSSGNPIYTTFGKHKIDQYRDDPEGFLSGLSELGWEDIAAEESGFWRDYTAPGGGGGYQDYGNLLDDRRAWQEQLYYGPRQSPQRAMEQQGFFDTMENAYAADTADTLKKGLYSQSFVHPGAGVMPWGMEKIWATGRAKGGIVSLVGE
tara:strand:- start:1289 stop:2131 length:843 start_codon:yes stop_codon:yes gene_type:complete